MKNEETIILLFGNDYQREITRTIEKRLYIAQIIVSLF